MKHSIDALIHAQNVHFPGSRIISRAEVIDRWVLNPAKPNQAGRTFAEYVGNSVAMALLQYDTILFYEYHGMRGARYGVEGPEYISGFGFTLRSATPTTDS